MGWLERGSGWEKLGSGVSASALKLGPCGLAAWLGTQWELAWPPPRRQRQPHGGLGPVGTATGEAAEPFWEGAAAELSAPHPCALAARTSPSPSPLSRGCERCWVPPACPAPARSSAGAHPSCCRREPASFHPSHRGCWCSSSPPSTRRSVMLRSGARGLCLRCPGRCPGRCPACDRDKGTRALLVCWMRGLGVVGSLPGAVLGVSPRPLQLSRSAGCHGALGGAASSVPSRPLPFKLSPRFNGTPWPRLKGLKSGIKAARARLLPDGTCRKAGAVPRAQQQLPWKGRRDPPRPCAWTRVCVCSRVWGSPGVCAHAFGHVSTHVGPLQGVCRCERAPSVVFLEQMSPSQQGPGPAAWGCLGSPQASVSLLLVPLPLLLVAAPGAVVFGGREVISTPGFSVGALPCPLLVAEWDLGRALVGKAALGGVSSR